MVSMVYARYMSSARGLGTERTNNNLYIRAPLCVCRLQCVLGRFWELNTNAQWAISEIPSYWNRAWKCKATTCTTSPPTLTADRPRPALAGGEGGAAHIHGNFMPLARAGAVTAVVVTIRGVAPAVRGAASVADEPGV